MNKRIWVIPVLVVAINALAIIARWNSMPELLPAHFDLQGNAGGSMSRNVLPLYPLIGAVVCLVFYVITRIWHKLQTALVILASGTGLILFSSTMVTLTAGKMPVFMLAEPVILLASVVASVVCLLRSRKKIETDRCSC